MDLLPTNEQLYNEMSALQQQNSANNSNNVDKPIDWSSLVDPKSTFKLSYALSIIHSLIGIPYDEKDTTVCFACVRVRMRMRACECFVFG